MNTVIIKQSPDKGADTKVFRAYFPGGAKRWDKQPVGVSASCTSQAEFGALRCAAKAFIKTVEPQADPDEIETRIKLDPMAKGIWTAELQPATNKKVKS